MVVRPVMAVMITAGVVMKAVLVVVGGAGSGE